MSVWTTALLIGGIVGTGLAPVVLLLAWVPVRRKTDRDEVTPRQRLAVLRNAALAIIMVVFVTAAGVLFLKKDAIPAAAAGMAPQMPGMPAGNMPGGMPAGNMPGASTTDVALPSRLAGLSLSQKLTGDQAMQQVASIHTSQIPVSGAVVGFYKGGGHDATVWAAFTSAPEMAGAMSEQMSQAIAAADTPFGTPQQMADGVWKMEGMGQVHYFFPAGTGVWWVSADPSLAAKSLDQVRTAAGL